jgi:hypothetical protein
MHAAASSVTGPPTAQSRALEEYFAPLSCQRVSDWGIFFSSLNASTSPLCRYYLTGSDALRLKLRLKQMQDSHDSEDFLLEPLQEHEHEHERGDTCGCHHDHA